MPFILLNTRVVMRSNDYDVVESFSELVLEFSKYFPQSSLHPNSPDRTSGLATDGKAESWVIQLVLERIDEQGSRLPSMSRFIYGLKFPLVAQAKTATESIRMTIFRSHQSFSSSR